MNNKDGWYMYLRSGTDLVYIQNGVDIGKILQLPEARGVMVNYLYAMYYVSVGEDLLPSYIGKICRTEEEAKNYVIEQHIKAQTKRELNNE